ncbi:DEAD/DEAH box helicase [Sabulicella rubraurantiaca]|uniref:DEAD/DEAH box helicase n=1 Tax=Sabulicella rubraurantiaca TaxID=2811429 RepID=UPI001A973C22|nr:DEAD/DEAH box helicase [Sabulicella rubraurantiaca]
MDLDPEGLLAARLIERAGPEGLIHLARSEGRAARLAEAARALGAGVEVLHLPGWDTPPYDRLGPSPALLGARMAALEAMRRPAAGPRLLILSPAAALQRLPAEVPPPLLLRPGDAVETAALEALGYSADDLVDSPGEFALRAAVLDVFPALPNALPQRLELEEGRIVAIRRFHPDTQRSEAEEGFLCLPPAREDTGGELVSPFELWPEAVLLAEPEVAEQAADFWREAEDGFRLRLAAGLEEGEESPREPGALFLDPAAWKSVLGRATPLPRPEEEAEPLSFLGAEDPEAALADAVAAALDAGVRVALAGAGARATRLARLLRARFGTLTEVEGWLALREAEPGTLHWLRRPLRSSFAADGTLVAAAAEILPPPSGAREARLPVEEAPLAPGDLVIHEEHGMARLLGIEPVEGMDCLRLEFHGGATRLVPAEELDRIWRYGAESRGVSLDRLGGDAWAKRRAEAEASLAETARGLVAALRAREGQSAPAWVPPRRPYARFCAGFPFELTPDQEEASAEVGRDLAAGRPMDRLVCGDVGFGKTEIALRAAAAVALAGGQVAVLAPTTVLARQHLDSFRRRFAPLGIAVGGLSRLTPAREARQTRESLAEGRLPIVVGTQAVLAKATRFAQLGLVIVDEEQRFGARQKQVLRSLAEGAHFLSMTATPIPRSLQGAMLGLQALSVLQTPPARRRPVRTAVAALEDSLLGEALRRERRRGGQSFVVVPRIEDLGPMRARLRQVAPRFRVAEAHGEMAAADADDAMLRFAEGRAEVLLCTAIVETGLDVPRAGTMLICGAERFGLAQLHQLRGRVGRGGQRGACWLLTEGEPPPAAARRLRALAEESYLGAGFGIAARDLDQRGAGDLLGEEQAGHVRRLGLNLTRHLMERALAEARGEAREDAPPVSLVLPLPAHIPEDYVREEALRIALHERIGAAQRLMELDAVVEEMEDRFGPLPESAEAVLTRSRLRLRARRLGATRLEAGPKAVAASFADEAPEVSPPLERKEDRILLRRECRTPEAMAEAAEELLARLRRKASPPRK